MMQWIIIKKQMDSNQFIAREERHSRRQFLKNQQGGGRPHHRIDSNHRFSQPKPRGNLIKINKNKLPGDFFLKREAASRRNLGGKFHLQEELIEPVHVYKKAESERLHYSPEKTSFFGFFEEQNQQPISKTTANSKLYNRKFQTRNEPKRDAYPIESARKLTTATKNSQNQLLELFPSTHDTQLTEIVTSCSNTRNLKFSPRKETASKNRESQLDPEKQAIDRSEKELREVRKTSILKVNNVSMEEPIFQNESLNMTFFNAKSTCFPPINRPANPE